MSGCLFHVTEDLLDAADRLIEPVEEVANLIVPVGTDPDTQVPISKLVHGFKHLSRVLRQGVLLCLEFLCCFFDPFLNRVLLAFKPLGHFFGLLLLGLGLFGGGLCLFHRPHLPAFENLSDGEDDEDESYV